MFLRELPQTISAEDFAVYSDGVKKWCDETADWIAENLGPMARIRFLDTVGMLGVMHNGQVNYEHADLLTLHARLKQNLERLIETDKWDGK